MGVRQTTDLVVNALVMALGRRHPDGELIHHADRGSQYTSLEFSTRLADWRISPSFSRTGNCFNSAAMESTRATIKKEIRHIHGDWSKMTRSQLRSILFTYIETFYTETATKHASGTAHPPTSTLTTPHEVSETRVQRNGSTPDRFRHRLYEHASASDRDRIR